MKAPLVRRNYGVREIANWIIQKALASNVSVTNMAVNKLVYFVYETALVNGVKLTNAKIEAWEHGPVFRELYHSFKEYGNRPIVKLARRYDPLTGEMLEAIGNITAEDKRLIDEVVSPLINLPASVLRDISHEVGGPWNTVWNHSDPINPGMQISDEIILDSVISRRRAS